MWSGTIATIPSGWKLCNGANGTPDLRDKFVVGAHSDLSGTAKSNVEGSYNQSGGDISHNHGGNTTAHTLTAGQIPSHNHTYKDSYYIEYNNPGVGANGAVNGVDYLGASPKYKGSGDSDNDNRYIYWRNGTTNSTGTGGGHSHPVPTDNHVPPYFALAYIMFTGYTM
jgi:microcystin-dependent protein